MTTTTTIEEDARSYVEGLNNAHPKAPVNGTRLSLRHYRNKWGTSSFDSILTVVLGEEEVL
jgi:hypothetical protein